MRKEILVLVVSMLLLVSTNYSQKNKNDQQSNQTQQFSLEENLSKLSKKISDVLIEKQLAGKERTNVSVADFVDLRGNSSEFGKFLAEELVTRLFEMNKFNVIKASSKNQRSIPTLDAIVGGTIGESDSNYRINVRITNAETGELVAAAGATVVKDGEVCSLVNCNPKLPSNNSQSSTESAGELPPKIKRRDPSEIPKTWKVDSNFFTFDLQRCRLSGSLVLCEFIITNNDKDRAIRIYNGDSVMFDDFGNQSKRSDMEIANSGYSATLISGVPVKARLTFSNVSPEATKITKLFISVHLLVSGGKRFSVEYQNIPLRE